MREISLHLMDILNNSLSAGATRMTIRIEADIISDILMIQVADNGKGMSAEFLSHVIHPFATTRTTRKVGLGLSLFEESCAMTGGCLRVESSPGEGTTVTATFGLSSIDRIPLGNMGETLSSLISAYPDLDFSCAFVRSPGNEFGFDTTELRERLGDIRLSDPNIYIFVRDYITEQQEYILGGI